MTLDLAHDILLCLLGLALVLVVLSHLIRRTPRVPECPRCRYRHEIPAATTCPECGLEPKDAGAWMRSRPAIPRGVGRWSLLLAIAIAPVTASIGVLHGRWASVLPTSVLIESLGVMEHGTDGGRSRVNVALAERSYTPRQADRLIRLALDRLEHSNGALLNAARAPLKPRNAVDAIVLRIVLRLEIDSATGLVEIGKGRQWPRDSSYLGVSSTCADPWVHRVLNAHAAANQTDQQDFALAIIARTGEHGRPMIPGLLRLICDTIADNKVPYLYPLVFAHEPEFREFHSHATPAQRRAIAPYASVVVGESSPGMLDALWEFLEQAEVDGVDVTRLRRSFDLCYPGGPDQWRSRASTVAPTASPAPPSP